MKYLFSFLIFAIFSIYTFSGEIVKTYHFSDYRIDSKGEYQLINFKGCLNTGYTGEPSMPWFAVKLLLPPGEEAVSFSVKTGDPEVIPGKFTLYPQQSSRPLSHGNSGEFSFNNKIYHSDKPYPAQPYGSISTEYMNGHSIAFLNICPLQFVPTSGQLSYYTEITVKIKTEKTGGAKDALTMLSGSKSVQYRLKDFVQNPEMCASYPAVKQKSDAYQLLIIVPQAFDGEFDQLQELYLYRGLLSEVVTTEYIGNNISGQDLQEKIRNYIIQEYQSNNIEYVLLAGDVEYVPYRGFYCYVQSGSGYSDFLTKR